jgi:hypothetical protein
MLLVMVVASAVFGWWVHRSREWIRQRQQWRLRYPVYSIESPPLAPGGLWLFGEKGIDVYYQTEGKEKYEQTTRLFPEANVIDWYGVGSRTRRLPNP